MKINTKTVLIGLDGGNLKMNDKDLTLGDAVSNLLLGERDKNPFNPLEAYLLAMDFYGKNQVEVNTYTLSKLQELIEPSKSFNTIVIGQVLFLLQEAKSEDKNKKVAQA